MTPGFAWALLVVLSLDGALPPPPTWHATRADCEARIPVEMTRAELAGQAVEWVSCQRVRVR